MLVNLNYVSCIAKSNIWTIGNGHFSPLIVNLPLTITLAAFA